MLDLHRLRILYELQRLGTVTAGGIAALYALGHLSTIGAV